MDQGRHLEDALHTAQPGDAEIPTSPDKYNKPRGTCVGSGLYLYSHCHQPRVTTAVQLFVYLLAFGVR